MLSKVTSIMQMYDEDGEPTYQALVVSYRLFGLVVYRTITAKEAITSLGAKV